MRLGERMVGNTKSVHLAAAARPLRMSPGTEMSQGDTRMILILPPSMRKVSINEMFVPVHSDLRTFPTELQITSASSRSRKRSKSRTPARGIRMVRPFRPFPAYAPRRVRSDIPRQIITYCTSQLDPLALSHSPPLTIHRLVVIAELIFDE
jgi:hypothetical protein